MEKIQLISPNRLMLGRNNRRSLSGPVSVDVPSRLLDQNQKVFEAWWQVWSTEKILEFIPQPAKWTKNSVEVSVGDLVMFPRDSDDGKFEITWRVGRIKNLGRSSDGRVRRVLLEYKNANENKFRQTERAVRQVAVIHDEGEIPLVGQLNEAAGCANVLFIQKNTLVETVGECKIQNHDQLMSFRCMCVFCDESERQNTPESRS